MICEVIQPFLFGLAAGLHTELIEPEQRVYT